MLLRLTRDFVFEMAHALPGYEGKCRNIHGHSYHLSVTVEGIPLSQPDAPDDGMVLDFHQLKQIVTQHIVEPFDHALVLPRTAQSIDLGPYGAKLILLDCQPTTEHLLLHFARLLDGTLPAGVRLHSLRLSETETSTAELIC